MSTALYPQGMRGAMPASGYNHKSTYYNKQYATWKGTGVLSNPVGIAPSHIRPLTNNDSGNVFLSGSFPSRTYPHTRVFCHALSNILEKGVLCPIFLLRLRFLIQTILTNIMKWNLLITT